MVIYYLLVNAAINNKKTDEKNEAAESQYINIVSTGENFDIIAKKYLGLL